MVAVISMEVRAPGIALMNSDPLLAEVARFVSKRRWSFLLRASAINLSPYGSVRLLMTPRISSLEMNCGRGPSVSTISWRFRHVYSG